MKLKTKLSTLLLGITSIFALTAAIVTNPNSGNAKAISVSAASVNFDFSKGVLSNNVITWNDGTLKITQKQGGSSTKPSYVSAPRWYSGHIITFNIVSDVKIESLKITCTSTKYAEDLSKSTWTGATCSLSSSTVTVIPNNGATEFSSTMKAQSRISSLAYDVQDASSTASLVSISADSTQKKVYQNQELDTSAITVTGHYDDGSEKQLYSGWTVECDTSVVATGVTATVTHTETNKTATFTVDVVEFGPGIIADGKYFISTSKVNGEGSMLSASSTSNTSSVPTADVFSTSDNSKAWTFTHIRHDSEENVYTIKCDTMSLYSINDSKGIRINTKSDDECNWQISLNTDGETYTISSLHTSKVRNLTCYNNEDWRSYAGTGAGGVQDLYLIPVSVLSGAETYAKEFLNTITCSGQGSITAAEGAWSTMETKFNALSDVDKETLASATGNDLGTDIERCIYRYEAIIMKYGTSVYNDFMSRGIVSPAHGMIKPNIVEDTPITEIIVIASISAVTLIGLFAISKKRKEN